LFNDTVLSPDLYQLVLGSLLGDASIHKDGANTGVFKEQHSVSQSAYLMWKHSCFGNLAGAATEHARKDGHQTIGFRTTALRVFGHLKAQFYTQGRYKHFTESILSELTPFSLAVWYQDDGSRHDENGKRRRNSIALHPTSETERDMLIRLFIQKFGLNIRVYGDTRMSRIYVSGEEADKFERIIAPYVHPSMSYKLRNTNSVGSALPSLVMSHNTQQVTLPCRVIEIRRKIKKGREAVRYNLQVEDNATYIVGTAVVHNSPEFEPGGKVWNFAPSIKVKMLTPNRKDQNILGLRPKTSKNKTAQPFREATINLVVSASYPFVDIVPELTALGKELGVFTNSRGEPISGGTWYFDGTDEEHKLTVGEAAVQSILYTDDDLCERVRLAVTDAIAALNRSQQIMTSQDSDAGAAALEGEEADAEVH
jgi:recombination protein RecA